MKISSVAEIARNPAKLFALFTGSAIVTLSYTFAMIAALSAFGANLPVAQQVHPLRPDRQDRGDGSGRWGR